MISSKKEELKQLMMAQAGLVEKMISMAIGGLYDSGVSFVEEVMIFEKHVNQIEMELESKCTALIALHQPEAKDLRVILMIYKINNDLERLGDQAVNIAESAAQLVGNPVIRELPELITMKNATLAMLKESLDAFAREDISAARKVCNDDNIVDDLNRNIYKHLVKLMKANPHQIDLYLHILRIAKNLERIGDLSTNIAENTIYLAVGKSIKHHVEEL
ncbi:MAG: phosphate transport system regulatory protein PhoU [Candidatus Cloacimonetes bacterium HGW-Cloacimonetes-3]|jgi:phosphate transport system protein|nr:MAG: phosphate transport system regulatory protein PhoU [Candidatus Cloacimonetes bacterium HGW-Cloacimonetes-3]